MNKKVYISLAIASLLSLLIGFLLAGGGHGWVSVFYFSLLPLLMSPISGYAVKKKQRIISAFVIVLYFIAIYILYFKTLEEGEGYFERVFNGVPGLTILFFIFWLFPLFINTYNLFRKKQVD